MTTSRFLAGLSAFFINVIGSLSYNTTSIFSPFNSFRIRAILLPFSPIIAPIGSISILDKTYGEVKYKKLLSSIIIILLSIIYIVYK